MWGCGARAWQGSLGFTLALRLVAPCGVWIDFRLCDLLKPAWQGRCKGWMPAPGRAACVWRWLGVWCAAKLTGCVLFRYVLCALQAKPASTAACGRLSG